MKIQSNKSRLGDHAARSTPAAHGRRGRPERRRRATAVVELAVCLPVLVPIVFASIEAASMIFVQQALQTTAYETARAAVKTDSTNAEARSWGTQMLQLRNVKAGSLSIRPRVNDLPPGTMVTVTVTADTDANRLLPAWFFNTGDMTASCTMQRE